MPESRRRPRPDLQACAFPELKAGAGTPGDARKVCRGAPKSEERSVRPPASQHAGREHCRKGALPPSLALPLAGSPFLPSCLPSPPLPGNQSICLIPNPGRISWLARRGAARRGKGRPEGQAGGGRALRTGGQVASPAASADAQRPAWAGQARREPAGGRGSRPERRAGGQGQVRRHGWTDGRTVGEGRLRQAEATLAAAAAGASSRARGWLPFPARGGCASAPYVVPPWRRSEGAWMPRQRHIRPSGRPSFLSERRLSPQVIQAEIGGRPTIQASLGGSEDRGQALARATFFFLALSTERKPLFSLEENPPPPQPAGCQSQDAQLWLFGRGF